MGRKALRQYLEDLFKAESVLLDSTEIYPSLPKSLSGRSPALAITPLGSRPHDDTLIDMQMGHVLGITLFVLYEDTGWTPEQSQDLLDDLVDETYQILIDDEGYELVIFEEDSSPDVVAEEEGVLYRIEVLVGRFFLDNSGD